MASNAKVNIEVASVGVSKATKETKTLREQIKDLKNEMANLTQGTEEYNKAAQELGNLMHQQAEISGDAKRAMEDYGQTLTNISSISAGVVGSFSAMNGVMNLIGSSSEESLEAIKKMQSLMAIVQGLSSMDAAEKAFRGLWVRIKAVTSARKADTQAEIANTAATKANTTAMKAQSTTAVVLRAGLAKAALGFKALGAAIKSFMLSNPLTAVLLAVTAIISGVTTLISKFKDAKEQAREMAKEIAAVAHEDFTISIDTVSNEKSVDATTAYAKKKISEFNNGNDSKIKISVEASKDQLERFNKTTTGLVESYKKTAKDLETEIVGIQEKMTDLRVKGEENSKAYTDLAEELTKKQQQFYYNAGIASEIALKQLEANIQLADKANGARRRTRKAAEEWLETNKEDYEKYKNDAVNIEKQLTDNLENETKKRIEAEKKAQADRDKQRDDYLKSVENKNREALAKLKNDFNIEQAERDLAYKTHIVTERNYYQTLLTDYEKFVEEFKKRRMSEEGVATPEMLSPEAKAELEQMEATVTEINRRKNVTVETDDKIHQQIIIDQYKDFIKRYTALKMEEKGVSDAAMLDEDTLAEIRELEDKIIKYQAKVYAKGSKQEQDFFKGYIDAYKKFIGEYTELATAQQGVKLPSMLDEKTLAEIQSMWDRLNAIETTAMKRSNDRELDYIEENIKAQEQFIKDRTALALKQEKVKTFESLKPETKAEIYKSYQTLVDLRKNLADRRIAIAQDEYDREAKLTIPEPAKMPTEKYEGRAGQTVDINKFDKAENDERLKLIEDYEAKADELRGAWWLKKFAKLRQYANIEIEEERERNDRLRQIALDRYEAQQTNLETDYNRKRAKAEQDYNADLELLKQTQKEELKQRADYVNQVAELEMKLTSGEIQQGQFESEMAELNAELETKLETEAGFIQQREDLERDHQQKLSEIRAEYNEEYFAVEQEKTEIFQQIAQERYEIEKEYLERQKEAYKNYYAAFTTITSSISGLLTDLQGYYEEGTKKYEELKEAQIIMDTITGSLAAFMSGVESGVPAPYNFILGGVLATIATAQGMIALEQLHDKSKGGLSSSASNVSGTSPYQTFITETGADIQGGLTDTRVWVAETDISETINKVTVAENESTF